MAIAGGVAGGLLGGLLASGLRRRLPGRPSRAPSWSARWSLLAACVTNGLIVTVPKNSRRRSASRTPPSNPRTADITVKLDPANAARRPVLGEITSWQGGGLVVDRAGADRRGRVPDDAADPDPRRLEGAAAAARRPDAQRRADLPAGRRGHPGPGDQGRGRDDPQGDPGDQDPPARADQVRRRSLAGRQPRRPRLHPGPDRGDELGRGPVLPPGGRPGPLRRAVPGHRRTTPARAHPASWAAADRPLRRTPGDTS